MFEFGKDKTIYVCGHTEMSAERIGPNREFRVGYLCQKCKGAVVGSRQTVVRYGDLPEDGRSYNYRDNRYEEGVSCYLPDMRPRPEFTSRKKITFSAVVIGWGSDEEPLIDASTIKG